ncbi:MAG TPA: ADP-ribosylglycohydrolase family protein [Acidimicrobiales bacterium]|nr:ADP-ribosylglycohydrolase family protein [Acidimicrobiales bacterium]
MPVVTVTNANDRWLGCVLGGAVGDALGAPVEFDSLASIRRQEGTDRLTTWPAGAGAVTDDTQMTLFTLEGLIRASVAARSGQPADPVQALHRAYLRWLATQDGLGSAAGDGGWLVGKKVLHHQRAPGVTCLSALRSGRAGAAGDPLNNSKGCGGVMRAAPCGLMAEDPERAFELGCASAALTHGHPSGWYPAGVLAATVCIEARGTALPEAVKAARGLLHRRRGAGETAEALARAVGVAGLRRHMRPEDLEMLGAGWVGEEALAIAVACALTAADQGPEWSTPAEAILLAASHSGDSDSTAAIAGNLLGAAWGMAALPEQWLRAIDVREIAEKLVNDAWAEWTAAKAGDPVDEAWRRRYPPG